MADDYDFQTIVIFVQIRKGVFSTEYMKVTESVIKPVAINQTK